MRRFWRVVRWGLLALLCLAGGVLLLNSIDDRLDPGAKATLEAPVEDVPRQQNLYYAVLGFATTGDDPEQAGWDEAQKALAELKAGASPYHPIDDSSPRVELVGDLEHLPALGDLKGSLDFARQHPDEAAKFLADNSRMVDRYARLYSYQRYVDPVPAAAEIFTPGPRWSPIFQGKRLRTLQLARDLPRDGPAAMVAWLLEDSRFWRRIMLEEETTLSDRILMVAQLRADFLLASQLLHLVPLDAGQLDALGDVASALSPRERALKGSWKREFREYAGLIALSTDEKQVASPDTSWIDRLDFRFRKLFYLPHVTLNDYHRLVLDLGAIDERPCSAYQAERTAILEAGVFTHASWRLVRNPLGSVLVDMSAGAHVDYPGHLCDLQGFQRLLALQVLLHRKQVAAADIPAFIRTAGPEYTDPYSEGPMQWLPEQHALSFGARSKRAKDMLPWPI